MESVAGWQWQGLFLGGLASWVVISSIFNVTQKIRSLTQPWVSRQVVSGTPISLQIQKYQHGYLDGFFSGLSCSVSVPFYTAFLPFLFWSGHSKLARQMTLLMAFCDYMGNCIKDVVSAPRPTSPPVRRITATEDEKENALEYGMPSSHTLNTICLSGYLLHYVLSHTKNEDLSTEIAGIALVCLLVGLIGLGRIYLGMHSLIDIIGGLAFGLAILAFWLSVHNYLDDFIVSGQNVTSFWSALTFLLLFAYPTPEQPTPSFEYHTAFNGVALGIVSGIQQTYHQFHHEDVPKVFTELSIPAFVSRMLVGIPTILLVKFCSKALAKWMLPMLANALSLPVRSTSYVPGLSSSAITKKSDETKPASGYLQKLFFFSQQDSFDVDTGIRLLQYTGLGWAVVDLVPSLFTYLRL
ncbi:PREDICTED: lipid phosphate phosphatase delta-like [Ipomoea nil]|uniref:lipid phosphate phosphatase delta-like n=1 Tax=Ipomoea nil TaxID=35883 RepID=UPI000901BAEB|nr:PREDICTED: lipid phosphate phosphatase delta-like [Ipomoea nil]